jgi:hypothetical protein
MDGMSTSHRIDEVSESYKDDEQKIVTKKLINMKN